MRLKPDKYHPRKLFQLNGDGKPYKPIDEKKGASNSCSIVCGWTSFCHFAHK